MSTVKNLFVLHKTGKIYYARNFEGETLDQSMVIGFSASVANFCTTLLGEDLREVVALKGRILYRTFGDFMFVVHCDLALGSALVHAVLRDLGAMCEFVFGSSDKWEDDFFDLRGAQDIVSMYIASLTRDPTVAVGGINQLYLETEVSERVDKLLALLESQDGVCGSGTAILLEDSVLASRFSLPITRMIAHYNKARPLGFHQTRYVPVFCNGAWHNLYFLKLHSYVLVVMAYLDKPLAELERKLEDFKVAFMQSRLEIPTEVPPVLLRLYAKRETLALLYHNMRTGNTIFPQLRPGAESQQKDIMSNFWQFFNDAYSNLRIAGVQEYALVKENYRFHARADGVHKLYVLLSADAVSSDSARLVTNDILKNIRTSA